VKKTVKILFGIIVLAVILNRIDPAAAQESKKVSVKKVTIQQEISSAIAGLKSASAEKQKVAIMEITRLAYSDHFGITAQAVPELIKLLKDEENAQKITVEQEGGTKTFIVEGLSVQAIRALAAIGDKRALPPLKEIVASGPAIVGEISTKAGYAAQAVLSIDKKEEFTNKLRNLSNKERIDFLIAEIKNAEYLPANEPLFVNLIIGYLTEIGSPAVAPIIDLLREALDVDLAGGKAEKFYTSYVYYIIPSVLGNIGDRRAIPILEMMLKVKADTGLADFAAAAIKKINALNP